MGYYTRVFCQAETAPALSEIQAFMNSLDPKYKLEGEADDDNDNWTDLEVFYKEGKHPIPVELNFCDEEDSVGKEELGEFLEEVGSPGLSIKKWKVTNHLKKTKFIVCNQLLSDLDDDGYVANDRIMQFFVERYKGMIHCENEGFYNSDGTVLLED